MAARHRSALMRPAARVLLPALLFGLATVAADTPEKPDDSDRQDSARTAPAAEAAGTADKGEKAEPAEKAEKDEKDEKADSDQAPLSLTVSQQQAVGIRIEQPLPLRSAPPIEAYGTVLDPAALVTELGRMESSQASAAAAAADAERTQRLYRDEAQASLKSWQASQAQSAEAAATARATAISFSLQWGPLASWSPEQRHALIEDLSKGRRLLLRADVPGRHLGGALDRRALVEVDGISVAAQVLGTLPRTEAQSQSAGWLLQLERVPPGFGPGARALVRLQTAALSGLLVPASALVYSEDGAYVYRQERVSGTDAFHYATVPVKPLTRVGSAWLVEGLNRADAIVVQGAGVLWSLQGISNFSAAEEEHD
jgi:hypothetical protein